MQTSDNPNEILVAKVFDVNETTKKNVEKH